MFRILIRPLGINDAVVSYEWRNDPDIWEFTGNRPDRVITKEIEDTWIRKVLAETDSFRFAIEVDGQYSGNIQITNVKDGLNGQYHIFIGEKKFWGKGVASQATYQIIRFAREILGLKELYLFVNPLNAAAIRVYEKCGFIKVSDAIKMVYDLTRPSNPTVSVLMITYNHGRFIKRAILSVLMQRTNFDFEIIIGEDCSTDGTRSIIKQIAEKYPGKFKLLLHQKNIGAVANQLAVSKASTGKYIAVCEGDDYWTDPDKLQKQVDFLEKNPDYGLVYGNLLILRPDGKLYPRISRKVLSYDDLLLYNPIVTVTTCFRKSLFDMFTLETIDKSQEWIMGDYPLYLWIFNKSKIFHFDDFLAVYLIRDGSSTGFSSFARGETFIRAVINIKTYFYKYYKGKSHLRTFVKEDYASLFRLAIEYRVISESIKYFFFNPLSNIRFLCELIWTRLMRKSL